MLATWTRVCLLSTVALASKGSWAECAEKEISIHPAVALALPLNPVFLISGPAKSQGKLSLMLRNKAKETVSLKPVEQLDALFVAPVKTLAADTQYELVSPDEDSNLKGTWTTGQAADRTAPRWTKRLKRLKHASSDETVHIELQPSADETLLAARITVWDKQSKKVLTKLLPVTAGKVSLTTTECDGRLILKEGAHYLMSIVPIDLAGNRGDATRVRVDVQKRGAAQEGNKPSTSDILADYASMLVKARAVLRSGASKLDLDGDGYQEYQRVLGKNGEVLREEMDSNLDGKPEVVWEYSKNVRVKKVDANSDGNVEQTLKVRSAADNPSVVSFQVTKDTDGDGISDMRESYVINPKYNFVDIQMEKDANQDGTFAKLKPRRTSQIRARVEASNSITNAQMAQLYLASLHREGVARTKAKGAIAGIWIHPTSGSTVSHNPVFFITGCKTHRKRLKKLSLALRKPGGEETIPLKALAQLDSPISGGWTVLFLSPTRTLEGGTQYELQGPNADFEGMWTTETKPAPMAPMWTKSFEALVASVSRWSAGESVKTGLQPALDEELLFLFATSCWTKR